MQKRTPGKSGHGRPPQGSVSTNVERAIPPVAYHRVLDFDFEDFSPKNSPKNNVKSSGQQCPLHPKRYWPVPFTIKAWAPGFAESVTVTALVRVPIALGVNVTVNVHFACAASVPVHGVASPATAM
jgi:hypothetical protein